MRRRYYKEEQRVKYTIRTNQGGRGGSRFMRMAYIKELWLMAYWNIMI